MDHLCAGKRTTPRVNTPGFLPHTRAKPKRDFHITHPCVATAEKTPVFGRQGYPELQSVCAAPVELVTTQCQLLQCLHAFPQALRGLRSELMSSGFMGSHQSPAWVLPPLYHLRTMAKHSLGT